MTVTRTATVVPIRPLTASAAPPNGRPTQIVLASGRVITVDHGQDFATLVRASNGS